MKCPGFLCENGYIVFSKKDPSTWREWQAKYRCPLCRGTGQITFWRHLLMKLRGEK